MLNFFKKNPNNANQNRPAPVKDGLLESERYYQEGVARLNDLIAPAAIKINARNIRVGETLAETIFIIAYPRYLHSNWFSPIINIDLPIDISMCLRP
jgi:hypothetical protein